MSEHAKTVSALNSELQQIDIELQQIADREREAERGISELSLAARRGDRNAATKLEKYDASCAEAMGTRRRLQAARSSVESELAMALALEKTEENKNRAREAKDLLAVFKKRGKLIDDAFRTIINEYRAILNDAAALQNLGAQVNKDLILANLRRAARAAVMPLKIDGVTMVPPQDRHSFDHLCTKWTGNAEPRINAVLNDEPPPTMPVPQTGDAVPPPPAPAAAPAPAEARSRDVAPRRNIHVRYPDDPPNLEIKPVEPRVH